MARLLCFMLAGSLLVSACGNAKSAADCQGEEGCHCYPNSTCNGTLSCLSNLCVDAGGAGGIAGMGGLPGFGGTATGGTSGSPQIAKTPVIWLRADAGIDPNSNFVASWLDQSGHADDARMPDLNRQPALVPGALNGLPVVRFSGAESLYLATPFSATRFSVFVVGKNSMPDDNYSIFLGPGGNTPNNQLRWETSSSVMIVGLGNNLPETVFAFGNTRSYHVLSARYDGSDFELARNGNVVGNASFATTGPWILGQVGAWFSTYFMQGDLAEIVLYDRSLSDAEFGSTAAFLRAKYAIE